MQPPPIASAQSKAASTGAYSGGEQKSATGSSPARSASISSGEQPSVDRPSDLSEHLAMEKRRRAEDKYDEGYLLDAVHMVPERGAGCCGKRASYRWALAVETLPQVVWGLWVDLPLRAKWLRLAGGSNTGTHKRICCWNFDRSFVFFVASSFNSMVVLCSVFVFNHYNVQQTWAESQIYCKPRSLGRIPCSNVTCPESILPGFGGDGAVATAEKLLSGATQHLNHSSWTGGCVPKNTSLGTATWCSPELRGRFTDKNGAPLEAWRFLHEVHQLDFDGSWLFIGFIAALATKVLLCSLVGWQFFYSDARQARCGCGCGRRFHKVASGIACAADAFAYCLCCGCLKCGSQRRDVGDGGRGGGMVMEEPSKDDEEGVVTAGGDNEAISIELVAPQGGDVHSRSSVANNDNEGKSAPTSTLGREGSLASNLREGSSRIDGGSNKSRNNSQRRSEFAHFFDYADIWRSKLRARDVQLMLRATRIMPRRKDLIGADRQDYLRVEWAKYLLGSGGDVDEGLVSKMIALVREQAAAQGRMPPLSSLSLVLSAEGSVREI
jgi:hypothetical protein